MIAVITAIRCIEQDMRQYCIHTFSITSRAFSLSPVLFRLHNTLILINVCTQYAEKVQNKTYILFFITFEVIPGYVQRPYCFRGKAWFPHKNLPSLATGMLIEQCKFGTRSYPLHHCCAMEILIMENLRSKSKTNAIFTRKRNPYKSWWTSPTYI